jgi:two-component system, NtrC family, response regulator
LKEKLDSMEGHANLSRTVPRSQARFDELIGQSAPMSLLYEMIAQVSQSISPVLVIGQTGTGKELVAQAIRFKGLRREKALVPVDCSALTSRGCRT